MNLPSRYLLSYPRALVYMLQASEYDTRNYYSWYWRTQDFRRVMRRRTLDMTSKARLLLLIAWSLVLIQIAAALFLIYYGFDSSELIAILAGVGLFIVQPFVTAHVLIVPLAVGSVLIQKPQEKRILREAQQVFAKHSGLKIAVAGSYGKTTTKEILKTILSQDKTVAATGGNLNTPLALADFASKLSGKEDVIIVEFGEFKPGDIARFAELVEPNVAIITGLNESHLASFKTLDNTAENLLSLRDFVESESLYINQESPKLKQYLKGVGFTPYSSKEALGWQVSAAKTSLDGTSFRLIKDKTKLELHSQLLGAHHVSTLALASALAHHLGLKASQIAAGVEQTKPFDHRFQLMPRGDNTVVIDDTYNGNIDGVEAGVNFVKGLDDFKRKVYVTPGLAEQGSATKDVHERMGRLIGPVFDVIVLMKNSTTPIITASLKTAGFKGELLIIDEPLDFYGNIDSFISNGDLVLMQNDWADNYA